MTVSTDIRTVAALVAGLEERLQLAEQTRDRAQAAATNAVDARRTAEHQRDVLTTAIVALIRSARVRQEDVDRLLGACLQASVVDRVLQELAA